MALIESLEYPNLTVGLSLASIYARAKCAEWPDALRWSQMVIDLADGDPSKGNFLHYWLSVSAGLYYAGNGQLLPGTSGMA